VPRLDPWKADLRDERDRHQGISGNHAATGSENVAVRIASRVHDRVRLAELILADNIKFGPPR
jgi:hypothetical protein